MPATFQKTINKTLENIPNNFNFLNDILIITKGTIADHISDIKLILKRLDEENLAIKLEKCNFAKLNVQIRLTVGIMVPDVAWRQCGMLE